MAWPDVFSMMRALTDPWQLSAVEESLPLHPRVRGKRVRRIMQELDNAQSVMAGIGFGSWRHLHRCQLTGT